MSTVPNMWYPVERAAVTYGCSCKQRRPLTHLYFCRHCLAVRCPYCISHEVDSLYCANCLENMPSSEARLKKNRCGSCFDCPSCFHTLSTRATSVSLARLSSSTGKDDSKSDIKPDPKSDPKAPKKMYYLSCFNCRWTSRDVGMPDQPIATGGWPEQMSVYSQRISQLQDHYKTLALQEKQSKIEKERKKFVSGKYMTLTDKIGLTSAMARARVTGSSSLGANIGDNTPIAAAAIPTADPNDLPADIFTKEVNLKYITNMEQRLAQPEYQPITVEKLFPSSKQLFIKRSQRCRQCDHNVTKPEYNPGSIKFKIQLFAYNHIPEVRIISCEPLRPGRPARLVLKLSNPTGHDTSIQILPLSEEPQSENSDAKPEVEEFKSKAQEIDNDFAKMSIDCCAQLVASKELLRLPQRDDASEYIEDTHNYNDDPKVVLWRKSNKLAIKTEVIPNENLDVGNNVNVGCILSYTYTNTVASTPRPPSIHQVFVRVYMNLGKIV